MENLPGLVVILGSPNDQEGNLSEMGQGRVACGLQEYLSRRDAGWKILLTGGFGEHFNTTDKPNAYYAKQILLENGLQESEIVEFAESRDTVDDALQARPIVERYNASALVVVSSDFHIDRVRFIFGEVFPDRNLSFAGADYLKGRSDEERDRLLTHEKAEIASLKKTRRSKLVGVDLDSWKVKRTIDPSP
jgi:vancomycin permeability regulator SanA